MTARPVMNAGEMKDAVERLAGRILSDAQDFPEIVLIGIARGGVPLAQRLQAQLIKQKRPIKTGILDITFYRDDLALRKKHPVIKRTEIPFDLDEAYVVLVDDVFFSGRTTRAAMDALADFGRPAVIRLAVMIDRGHHDLPIQPNFVGLQIQTQKSEKVKVCFTELGDSKDEVFVQGSKE